MKITVYTITDCQFSKAEKEYLQSHNLPFEEKNLEQNREWLTEMLAVSNNFAGTPVTKIEKDDGQIVVLKGFTKEEFDNVFGFTQKQEQAPLQPSPQPTASQPLSTTAPTAPTPPPPTSSPSDNPSPISSQPSPVQPPPPSPQPTATTQSPQDPLASILNELENKTTSTSPSNTSPPTNTPNIPDFNG